MAQALLVNVDLDAGAKILGIMDRANVRVSIAAWIVFDEYGDWRLLLSSPQLDATGPGKASGLVFSALVAADFPVEKTPTILILPTTDSTVRSRIFGKAKTAEGVRLGGRQIGKRWVEDAYVYGFRNLATNI
ncbi:MAG: hypothetical protein ABSG65_21090 [Bryobacteraceae bacterium]